MDPHADSSPSCAGVLLRDDFGRFRLDFDRVAEPFSVAFPLADTVDDWRETVLDGGDGDSDAGGGATTDISSARSMQSQVLKLSLRSVHHCVYSTDLRRNRG